MELTEGGVNMIETPRNAINNTGSHDSVDSGYSTLTSYSEVFTPIEAAGSRASGKRHHHRIRLDPLRSDRALRHRSKLNQLLNGSDNDFIAADKSKDVLLSFSEDRSFAASSSIDQSNQSIELHDFDSGFRRRTRRAWRNTSVVVTPASARLPIMSSPLSPALPSSSFVASEPIEEDVEMKLVIVPQSTPQPTDGSCINAMRSEIDSASISEDHQKLSKLSIADLAVVPKIKPKRLDFSHRASSGSFYHTRATPDYTDRETVDILSALGEKSNHWRIVSKILGYLQPQDLCAVSMVSKTWRRLCINDTKANTRRLTHVILRQNFKENLKVIKKAKTDRDLPTSPRSRHNRKGYLLEVQNLLQVPPKQRPPNSPPVSPSKIKFHSFVKASRTLAPWEHLLPCPKCSFPCHVNGEKNVGTCSRQSCSMEFCTFCSSEVHVGPCKTPLLATPTKRNKRILIVGSRQSKRNLRRL